MVQKTIAKMDRRKFVGSTTIGALAFHVAGGTSLLTPKQAHAEKVGLRHFDAQQISLLSAFCEHLLPGATDGGVVEFIDHQLGETPNECLLMCKYFPGINAPYVDFYTGGLASLETYTQHSYAKNFANLTMDEKDQTVQALWAGKADPWQGPPPPLFYMMLRSDAVDVVYGTEGGFEELGIPYMAHIRPPADWSNSGVK